MLHVSRTLHDGVTLFFAPHTHTHTHIHLISLQNASSFSTNGGSTLDDVGLEQNKMGGKLERVPWVELKELASNNLEIVVSVSNLWIAT